MLLKSNWVWLPRYARTPPTKRNMKKIVILIGVVVAILGVLVVLNVVYLNE